MGMFSQTDQDLHHAAYIARTTKINRERWMTEGLESSAAPQAQGERSFVERMRRRFGETLIGMGERLKGTSPDPATTPTVTGYGHAS
jgi:hypothetical protein